MIIYYNNKEMITTHVCFQYCRDSSNNIEYILDMLLSLD